MYGMLPRVQTMCMDTSKGLTSKHISKLEYKNVAENWDCFQSGSC